MYVDVQATDLIFVDQKMRHSNRFIALCNFEQYVTQNTIFSVISIMTMKVGHVDFQLTLHFQQKISMGHYNCFLET